MEGSRPDSEDKQTEDSAGILLRTRDREDKQPRLGGLGDSVTAEEGEEEDDGDKVLGVWVEELSPADVARLASPAPSSSPAAAGAPFFSSFLAAASAL